MVIGIETREFRVGHPPKSVSPDDVSKGASALEQVIRLAGKVPDYLYCVIDTSQDPFPSLGAQIFTKAMENLGQNPAEDTAPACELRTSNFEHALELACLRIQSGLSRTVALVNLAGPAVQADGLGALLLDAQGTAVQRGQFYTNVAFPSKHVPDGRLTNEQLSPLLALSPEDIGRRTKILERPVAGDGDTLITFAASVARKILEKGGISKSQVKYLLLSSSTPFPEPGLTDSLKTQGAYSSIAECVADELGFKPQEVRCIDVLAGCAGWCYAVDAGRAIIESGPERFTDNYVLAIATEVLRGNLINVRDKNTSVLFGDAAAGAALNASRDFGILATVGAANGSLADLIRIGSPDPTRNNRRYAEIKGKEVFEWAVEMLPRRIMEAAQKAGVEPASIDYFIIHQANGRITQNVALRLQKELGIPMGRFYSNIAYRANTSSASVPLSLADAVELNEIQNVANVLLCSFGAAGEVMLHHAGYASSDVKR